VVGNRGMGGMRRFVLDSVPNKVAHHCSVSVLIEDVPSPRLKRPHY
jgi:nucleotide-binding universal stress UspA family protein